MQDVVLAEDVKLDGNMESWVWLVFLDATYFRLQQKEEEEVFVQVESQEKQVESIWKGRYSSSQRKFLRSGQDDWCPSSDSQ